MLVGEALHHIGRRQHDQPHVLIGIDAAGRHPEPQMIIVSGERKGHPKRQWIEILLLAVGDDARHAVEAFGPGATWFASVEDLVDAAKSGLHAGVTIMVKGSRSNRLERVADALAARGAETGAGSH